jgi:hypothetical protein
MGKISKGIDAMEREISSVQFDLKQGHMFMAGQHWKEAKRLHAQYLIDKQNASGKTKKAPHKKQEKIRLFEEKWKLIFPEYEEEIPRKYHT